MINNRPLVTAIIVVYKSEKYINRCIDSLVVSAKYAKILLEIIVVVNDIENKNYIFPQNIRLVKAKHNLGYAKGLNEGAKIAKGKWLLILNPDTITREDALKYLFIHFQSHSTAIVAPLIQNPNKEIQLTLNGEPTLWNEFLERSYLYKIFPFIFKNQKSNKNLYHYSHLVNAVEGTYFAVCHTVFKRVGGFDERFFMYFEDMDLCKRITDSGYKIIFEPKAKILHAGQHSSKGVMIGRIYTESLYKYLIRYNSRYYALSVMSILIIGSYLRLIYWKIRVGLSSDKKETNFGINKIKFLKNIIVKFSSK